MEKRTIKLEVGDILEREYAFDGRLGSHKRKSDYELVIEAEDGFAMIKIMDKPDALATMLNPVEVEIPSGRIIGMSRTLISRVLDK